MGLDVGVDFRRPFCLATQTALTARAASDVDPARTASNPGQATNRRRSSALGGSRSITRTAKDLETYQPGLPGEPDRRAHGPSLIRNHAAADHGEVSRLIAITVGLLAPGGSISPRTGREEFDPLRACPPHAVCHQDGRRHYRLTSASMTTLVCEALAR